MAAILDNAEAISRVDRGGMLSMVRGLPEDLERALELCRGIELPRAVTVGARVIEYSRPRAVVVAGMGGSAIGGDVVSDLLRDSLDVPVVVSRQYSLPRFAGPGTLVVAVSYSGNTEETISSLAHALKRGCMVACIASDGVLLRICERAGLPAVAVPQGYQPRAAIAYLTVPILAVIREAGLNVGDLDSWVRDAAKTLRELREGLDVGVPLDENPAKQLALKLHERLPMIYSYWPYSSAGLRFKTQLNENSKVLAHFDVVPEMNHNEVEGWEGVSRGEAERYHAVLMRGSEEPPEVAARVEFLVSMLGERGVGVTELRSRGGCRFAEIMSLMYQGDYASCYLAALRGVDPTPVATISRLKSFLAARVDKVGRVLQELSSLLGPS
ncbi:MAG: bifunctional phosphoglucose/phosphomannose isomerase [Thermoprotei archaeon]|nr:MAG: bifunctional phosphoglucose/phosphomannose isomerase [Thermoprotei archaeon]